MQFTQQVKLFDRKFVTNTLRSHYRCPKCQNEFTHNYQMVFGDTHVKSNRPFLLPCGHNMCENCIFQNRINLTCNVCLRPVEIPMSSTQVHSQFYVRDFFDINFFLFGAINYYCFNRRNASNNNSFHVSVNNALSLNAPQIVMVQKCGECEAVPSIGYCKHCKVNYCNLCFDAVHKNSKVLKRHKLFREERKPLAGGQMPKQSMCQRHHKICDRYCKKCRLVCCTLCIRSDHSTHGWCTVIEENEKTKADVYSLLETIKNSRDNLKKAQKDVKCTEIQLDEYATQTVHDISKYFLELHSFLQLEEHRILDEFNEMAQHAQEKLREAYFKLGETQNTLNSMRSTIEFHQRKPPTDILLHEVISATNTQLEQLPCQVQISKERLSKNPFLFQAKRDIFKEFSKYFLYEYVDPQLSIRIGPIYGDINRSILETQSSMEDTSLNIEEHKIRNNKRNQKKKQATAISCKQSYSTTTSQYTSCTTPSFSHMMPKMNPAAIEAVNPPTFQQHAQPYAQKSGQEEHVMRICHVTSPEQFYVQKESTLLQIRQLSNKYVNYSFTETVPRNISEGNYYMAYYAEDKLWYRGLVKKILDKDLYKIFLIDLGMHLNLPKHRLCDIDESSLAMPHAAVRCAIHDLMPAGGKCWSEEATQLLIEITRNNPVRVSIIEQIKNNSWKVDLITTHTAEPISLRDSFLYTGLAQERPGAVSFKLHPKRLAPVSRINQRLAKQTYQQGEMLTVQTTHVEDPQEFYVIRTDQCILKKQMCENLNQYRENHGMEQIYLGSLQMCCAMKLRDVWHRGCVEEIKEGGKIRVRLVDEGSHEVVNWNELFVLPDKYREQKEFAIKCALADIEPLQENNYTWTDEAIKQFKQLCANPLLQLFVIVAKNGEHKVSLHVNKKHIDINIGAMIVKYGYGLSTGEATQVPEIFRTPKKRLCMPNPLVKHAVSDKEDCDGAGNETKNSSSSLSTMEKPEIKILKRTPVTVRHIETPGEFYIAIKGIEAGIRNFHRQIQERELHRQQLRDRSSEVKSDYKDWFVGDHCLVCTHLSSKQSEQPSDHLHNRDEEMNEYYRGIIVAIELEPEPQRPFVLFLRDVGATVRSIKRTQLHAIDAQLDRVTNAVQRCHLACVQPTGGVSTWSQTSIEIFKRNCKMFSNLSITLQGDRRSNSKSIPVVLWGMTTETADPLAPCISKYANINRILVNAGLAHLVERLDVTKQMDRFMQQELQEGEITIEEWFKNFSENKALKVIEHAREVTHLDNQFETDSLPSEMNSHFELNSITAEHENEPFLLPTSITENSAGSSWLKSKTINKSIFAGYPTYVDFDAIIYLHDADDRDLLKKLRVKIEKIYSKKTVPDENESNYLVGQACLAMYHQDNHLYRVIVKRVLPDDEFDVFFIDYGNVERCKKSDLRPFMPFPKLPSIASKYRIVGICPKNGEAAFPTKVLDIMHATIVGKLVSVRVNPSQACHEVKNCSIRIGAEDLAELLIAQGLVDSKPRSPDKLGSGKPYGTKHCQVQPAMLKALQVASDEDSDQDEEDEDMALPPSETAFVESKRRIRGLLFTDIEKKLDISQRQHLLDFEMHDCNIQQDQDGAGTIHYECDEDVDDELDERFNQYLDQLDNDDMAFDNDVLTNIKDTLKPNDKVQQQQSMLTPPPPTKKRMFDLDEYKKIHEQLQQGNLYKSVEGSENFEPTDFDALAASPVDGATNAPVPLEEDEDVVELEHSFASNYWHIQGIEGADKETVTKECNHIAQNLEKTKVAGTELETSDFDKFLPNETSSVFSHISGIEFFKAPKLPTGMDSFFCTVVSIITPTILHIFPHLAELEYRETELERRIKHLVKDAPPLKQFVPKYTCLACYSKDKKWYRALIRSHNPAAKTVDVLYVDYLNTETVPVKCLREYPMELSAWPLRTFRVKLFGLEANPRMREKDVRTALYNVVGGRTLHARVEKQAKQKTNASSKEGGIRLLEVSLYESKKSESANVIYEELIAENFYCRI